MTATDHPTLSVGGVRKPWVETKTSPRDFDESPSDTSTLSGVAMSVRGQPNSPRFWNTARRPTTLSEMATTTRSSITRTPLIDWRSVGMKMVSAWFEMTISSASAGRRHCRHRASSDPAL